MKNLLLAALILFAGKLTAQTTAVSGIVKDSLGQPLTAATVQLFSARDSVLVKTAVSGSTGSFNFPGCGNVPYFILINSEGYFPLRSGNFNVTGKEMILEFMLRAQVKELAAITLNTRIQKPPVEILADRTIFNVQGSISSTGTSAWELLHKAPGIIVDNNDNLIVEGKTGVAIYIDGRPSPLAGSDMASYLKTLQAADIDAVEIITQPSSRYDAAGTAGIINLRLKKNRSFGTNGSISAGYAVGIFSKYNSSLSLNNRSRNLNLFVNYSNSIARNRNYLNLYRFQGNLIYDLTSFALSDNRSHNLRAGMDWSVDKKSTLGFILNGNFSGFDMVNNAKTPISSQTTGQSIQVLKATSMTTDSSDNMNANLNYRFAGSNGKELGIDADYGYFRSSRNSFQPNDYYTHDESTLLSQAVYRMITPITIRILSAKLDYLQNLWKGRLSAGIKVSEVLTDNTFSFYDVKSQTEELNAARSNVFDYTEHINAGYLNYTGSYKKLTFQGGLRVEETRSQGRLNSSMATAMADVSRHYTDLFPSAGLTYDAGRNNTFAIVYSRRIDRPAYRALNPFESKTDELSYSKGNAFLKPQYTDNIKLSHTFKHRLTTSLSYSYTSDFMAQVTDTIEGNRNFISPQNIATQQVINVGISYSFAPVKWWNVFSSINAYRSMFASGNAKFFSVNQNVLSAYVQNNFTLPKKLRLEVSGWGNTPSIWGGTYKTGALASIDIALQKLYLMNKLAIRISISDIFNTSNWAGTTRYGQLVINGSGGYESRQLRLNLAYNFGRKEIKQAAKKKTGIEDESNRVEN